MALTEWISYGSSREVLAGVGDPYGRSDTANQTAREFWANLKAEHNEDGTHKVGGLSVIEEGAYSSTISGGDKVVSLTNSSLIIDYIMITSDLTQYPVMASADMTANDTKEFGTNAFQTNMIKSISTTGQFTVGTDDAVNAQATSEDYNYFVIGHE